MNYVITVCKLMVFVIIFCTNVSCSTSNNREGAGSSDKSYEYISSRTKKGSNSITIYWGDHANAFLVDEKILAGFFPDEEKNNEAFSALKNRLVASRTCFHVSIYPGIWTKETALHEWTLSAIDSKEEHKLSKYEVASEFERQDWQKQIANDSTTNNAYFCSEKPLDSSHGIKLILTPVKKPDNKIVINW